MSFCKINRTSLSYNRPKKKMLSVFHILAAVISFHLQLTAVMKAGCLALFTHIILCIIG